MFQQDAPQQEWADKTISTSQRPGLDTVIFPGRSTGRGAMNENATKWRHCDVVCFAARAQMHFSLRVPCVQCRRREENKQHQRLDK